MVMRPIIDLPACRSGAPTCDVPHLRRVKLFLPRGTGKISTVLVEKAARSGLLAGGTARRDAGRTGMLNA
jgi:hypothetical protein